jgi:hypothetical protein
MSSHFENWSFNGLSNLQRTIATIKTHWIEKFLISLESSWNVDIMRDHVIFLITIYDIIFHW